MGGYGSGRQGRKALVEDCMILDGYKFLPSITPPPDTFGATCRQSDGHWGWYRRGQKIATIDYSLNGTSVFLDYILNKKVAVHILITTTGTSQPHGGQRFWFRCPANGCGRMVAKLYLPPWGRYFACRHCYDLTYQSCNDSHQFDSVWAKYMEW